ncbi:MAG: hypothetical protein WCK52_11575 [Betaproteobacteria bacterium]
MRSINYFVSLLGLTLLVSSPITWAQNYGGNITRPNQVNPGMYTPNVIIPVNPNPNQGGTPYNGGTIYNYTPPPGLGSQVTPNVPAPMPSSQPLQQSPGVPSPPPPRVIPKSTSALWYYCEPKATYYPYVTSCPEGWTPVPATPPLPPRLQDKADAPTSENQ